jgi:hypothetical protein
MTLVCASLLGGLVELGVPDPIAMQVSYVTPSAGSRFLWRS